MKKIIITIAREYGSGGRKIGKIVADTLGIDFYDKEIISLSAKKTGFSEEFIRQNDERRVGSLIYDIYFQRYAPSVFEQASYAISGVLKDIADKGSCVIVGRAADSVLKDYDNCLNVFIHAPIEYRMERVKNEYGVETQNYRKYIEKIDKERAAFYNFSSEGKWGDMRNYHLTLSSAAGEEAAAEAIVSYAKRMMG